MLEPTATDLYYLDKLNTDPYQDSLTGKYNDRNGLRVVVGKKYYGYTRGVFIAVFVGPYCSLVQKITSAKGVPVQKPKLTSVHNWWLRRIDNDS